MTAKGARISVTDPTSKAARDALMDLALQAETEIRWLYRNSQATVPVHFTTQTKKRTLRRSGCVFTIDNSQSVQVVQNHMIRALLYRRMIAKRPVREVKPRHIPDWLVSAVQYRSVARPQSAGSKHWYVVTRILARDGRLPELRAILNLPVPPTQPLVYDLYVDLSSAALQVLLRTDPAAIPKLMAKVKPIETPYKALLPLIPIKDKSDPAVKDWFVKRIDRLLNGAGMGGTPASVKQALKRIETIQVQIPKENRTKEVALDRVREVDPRYKYVARDLDHRLEQLYRLQHDAPPLLQPAVREYIKAVTYLRHKGERKFREHLAQARNMFEQSFTKAEEIHKLLLKIERTQHTASNRLARYQPFFSAGLPLTDFEESLQKLLLTTEKRLEEKL